MQMFFTRGALHALSTLHVFFFFPTWIVWRHILKPDHRSYRIFRYNFWPTPALLLYCFVQRRASIWGHTVEVDLFQKFTCVAINIDALFDRPRRAKCHGRLDEPCRAVPSRAAKNWTKWQHLPSANFTMQFKLVKCLVFALFLSHHFFTEKKTISTQITWVGRYCSIQIWLKHRQYRQFIPRRVCRKPWTKALFF